MIIDFHTHIFSPVMRERRAEYVAGDPVFAEMYSSPKAKIATAEELVASMDECGIHVSVVLNAGWVSQDLCRETNDYLLEAAARFSGRLIPFCTVQPLAGESALLEVERCARGGARGIGEMRADMQGFDMSDPHLMSPLADLLVSRNLLFLTHSSEPVGHTYPGKGRITPQALWAFITSYPAVKTVCAHWGGGLPFYSLMPEVGEALSNVWFDTAATSYLYRPQIFAAVAGVAGADRILFGSDYPLLSQRRVIGEVQAGGLSKEAAEAVLGGNAARLLNLIQ